MMGNFAHQRSCIQGGAVAPTEPAPQSLNQVNGHRDARRLDAHRTNAEMTLRNREGIIWRCSLAFVTVLALALFSTFAWGLQYKLSLYTPSERSKPTMPVAKLISPKERPLTSPRSQRTDPHGKSLITEWEPVWGTLLVPTFASAVHCTPALIEFTKLPSNYLTMYSRPPPTLGLTPISWQGNAEKS